MDCKNGYILFIFITNQESFIKTVKEVNGSFSFITCTNHIYKEVNKSKKWAINFSRENQFFIDFCNELFACQKSTLVMAKLLQSTPISITTISCSSDVLFSEHINVLSLLNSEHSSSLSDLGLSASYHNSV